ncbi:MAG: hypothetical protein AAF702_50650 [Chloroflexota bacterium]
MGIDIDLRSPRVREFIPSKEADVTAVRLKKVPFPHVYLCGADVGDLTGLDEPEDKRILRSEESGARCDACGRAVYRGEQSRVFLYHEHETQRVLQLEVDDIFSLTSVKGLQEYLSQIRSIAARYDVNTIEFKNRKNQQQ